MGGRQGSWANLGPIVTTNVQPFSLDYFEPAEDLRGLVSSYYLFRADLPYVADQMRADLAQMRFMIAGNGTYLFADDRTVRTPEVSLIGPTMGASRFDVIGPLLVFGIGIHPAGWATVIRDDASVFADDAIDATALFGPLMTDALDAMRNAPSPVMMVAIADMVMRSLLQRSAPASLWFTRVADDWLTGAASPQVDALVESAGMSARQVERLARRMYGAPPKLLARKYRALRAASLIGAHGLNWNELGGDAFYDQSHFIREFKRFTGQTPRQFQRDPSPVTRLMLKRRTLPGMLPPIARVS